MYTRFSNLFDVLLGTLAHAYNMLLAHTCSVGAKYQLRQALCMHDRLRINNFNLQCMYACILPTGTLRVCVCVCVCVCVKVICTSQYLWKFHSLFSYAKQEP